MICLSSYGSGLGKVATMESCGGDKATGLTCAVDYTPPPAGEAATYTVGVRCGKVHDTLTLLASEKTVKLRVFSDWTFAEAFWQGGRTAMTIAAGFPADAAGAVTSTAPTTVSVGAWPLKGIWTTEAAVREQPRVYSYKEGVLPY